MSRKLLFILSVFILLAGPASAFAAKTYRAEHFDATWQINPDGSLSVVETVVFNFSGGPFTFVYRELRSDKSDGIEVQAASMDGQPLTAGQAAGQYEITGRGTQKVTWHFAPTSDSTHSFELRYRVLGAVHKDGAGDDDLLYWHFLPTDYDYPIASATLVVSYPPTAARISKAEIGATNSSTFEQDGQVTFRLRDVRKDTRAPVSLRFAGGSLISQPPAWQQHAREVADRAPTVWLTTAIVSAVGALFLAMAWRQGARPAGSIAEPSAMLRSAPPSDLPPALAGALVNFGGKAGLVQAMATLFRLAQAGVITFEETAEKKWYRGAQFVVRFQPRALDAVRLDPHEEALIDGLFKDKSEIALSELGRRLGQVVRPFGKAVEAELASRGLLDAARVRYGRGFTVLGVILIVAMAPAIVAAGFVVGTFGAWPFLIPLVMFLLSLAAFLMGSAYSVRSGAGEAEAAAWRGFRDYVKGVVKGREPNWDVRLFDRYFPYAATFDVAEGWAKAFRERGGGEVPGWFRSLSAANADRMGAFVALTAASHSSTSSSGGGAGGAGGGGGSGAG